MISMPSDDQKDLVALVSRMRHRKSLVLFTIFWTPSGGPSDSQRGQWVAPTLRAAIHRVYDHTLGSFEPGLEWLGSKFGSALSGSPCSLG